MVGVKFISNANFFEILRRNVPDTSTTGAAALEKRKSDLLDFYVAVCCRTFLTRPDSQYHLGARSETVLWLLALRRCHAHIRPDTPQLEI